MWELIPIIGMALLWTIGGAVIIVGFVAFVFWLGFCLDSVIKMKHLREAQAKRVTRKPKRTEWNIYS